MCVRYVQRYDKFINAMKHRAFDDELYSEKHHIVPRCMNGSNDESNLIKLYPREHYIAHMLLALAYPTNFKLISAFIQMAHKNTKKVNGLLQDRVYTSRMYHKLKVDFYDILKQNNQLGFGNKGFVYARTVDTNELMKVTSEEFKNNTNLRFHTKGMVYATMKISSQPVYVTSDEYKNNPDLIFHTNGMVSAISNSTSQQVYVTCEEFKNNPDLYFHTNGMVHATSITTSQTHYVTCEEYRNNPDLTFHTKGMINATSKTSNIPVYVTCEEYNANEDLYIDQSYHEIPIRDILNDTTLIVTKDDWSTSYKNVMCEPEKGKLKKRHRYVMVKTFSECNIQSKKAQYRGMIGVRCKQTNAFLHIDPNLYNPLLHDTPTKGKVLCKDQQGNLKLVSKQDFNSGEYVGQTKGLCKVLDKQTNTIVLITKSELQNDPERYEGHMKGKINVVDKTTGLRLSIKKEDYDKSRFCAIGNSSLLFECVVKETGKQKKINYFEYLIFPYKYDIIDFIKFDKITAQHK